MKVKTKKSRERDLSDYTTYAWVSHHEPESNHILAAGSPAAERLESIADPILAKYGLRLASDGPELLIRYTGVSREMVSVEGTTRDFGAATWVGDPNAHAVLTERIGTLLLEFVEAEEEQLVWAGWANDTIDTVPNSAKVAKKIEKATKKILKELP